MQNYESQLPYAILAEWGGLAHPPIQEFQLKNLQEFSSFYAPIDYSDTQHDSSRLFNVDFQINLDKVSNSELSKGNTYHLLADSKSFQAKLALIQSAAKTIWLSSLVFVDDITTSQIVAALIQKTNKGVEVRIITENAMSYVHPQQIKKCKLLELKFYLLMIFLISIPKPFIILKCWLSMIKRPLLVDKT